MAHPLEKKSPFVYVYDGDGNDAELDLPYLFPKEMPKEKTREPETIKKSRKFKDKGASSESNHRLRSLFKPDATEY